jgi:hypothetical protein
VVAVVFGAGDSTAKLAAVGVVIMVMGDHSNVLQSAGFKFATSSHGIGPLHRAGSVRALQQ